MPPFIHILFWNSLLYVMGIIIAISVACSSFRVSAVRKELPYIFLCFVVMFLCVFYWVSVVRSPSMDISQVVDTESAAIIERVRPSDNIELFVPVSSSDDKKEYASRFAYFGQRLDGTLYKVLFDDSIVLSEVQDEDAETHKEGIFLQWQDVSSVSFFGNSVLPKLLVHKNILTKSYSSNAYVQLLLFLCLILLGYVSLFLVGYGIELYFVRLSFIFVWLLFLFYAFHHSTQGFWWLVGGTAFFLVTNIVLIVTLSLSYRRRRG